MAEENKTDELDADTQAIVDEELAAAADATAKEKDDTTIPKERLDDALAKNNALQTQLDSLQTQFNLLVANATTDQPPKPEAARQADIIDGIFTEDDAVVEPRQLKEGLNRVLQYVNNAIGTLVQRNQKSDMDEVLLHLPEVLQKDPTLLPRLQRLQQIDPASALDYAYTRAKASPTYLKKQSEAETVQQDSQKMDREIQELLKNRKLPQSISALGAGGGTGGGGGSPLFDKMMQLDKVEDFSKFVSDLRTGAVKLPDITTT